MQFFDDVAAYWFAFTLLAFAVVPRGLYLAYRVVVYYLSRKGGEEEVLKELDPETQAWKREKLREYERRRMRSKIFTFWNCVWFALALVFVYALAHRSSFAQQELMTFDPYAILGVDRGSDAAVIKKVRAQPLPPLGVELP